MILINYFVTIVGIAIAIVFGIWLKKATKEELKDGRKWFNVLVVIGIVCATVFLFLGEYAASLTSLAIAILAGISLRK